MSLGRIGIKGKCGMPRKRGATEVWRPMDTYGVSSRIPYSAIFR